jgi:hypothetical protein
MSTLIIGAGLSGLACGIKTKLRYPDTQVNILDKRKPQSNTQIAGLRVRARKTHQGLDPEEEICQLLAERNSGLVTESMRYFASLMKQELDFWKAILDWEDKPDWFGPQFEKGNGTLMLQKLKKLAQQLGIKFIIGEAARLEKEGSSISRIIINNGSFENYILRSELIVLAAGNIGGSLFISTNRPITNSSHELAFAAGLSLIDSTIHMFHPFGRSKPDGSPLLGCFETDKIAQSEVYFSDGIFDEETTQLLREHKAHECFPQICKRFLKYGGVVKLIHPDGRSTFARVSHHYSHMAIETSDGVNIVGVDNLLAVGDASNLGFWNGHKERLPGFALLKCFIDAELVQGRIGQLSEKERRQSLNQEKLDEKPDSVMSDRDLLPRLRAINTKALFDLTFGNLPDRRPDTLSWISNLHLLNNLQGKDNLVDISLRMADTYRKKLIDPGIREPIKIERDLLPVFLTEAVKERSLNGYLEKY